MRFFADEIDEYFEIIVEEIGKKITYEINLALS